jgi:ABC-type Fe3+-hydroxamate transport system substrate-binding protein
MSDTISAYIDQMGNNVAVPVPPKRIISLVPSQTELLADLGLDDTVVGITKFCIHPERWKLKQRVGGTKQFNLDIIDKLAPDLIIGNKEEN